MRTTVRTTLGADNESAEQIRKMAKSCRIEVRYVPRLLLQGWALLTPKQQAEAMLRFSNMHERKLVTA